MFGSQQAGVRPRSPDVNCWPPSPLTTLVTMGLATSHQWSQEASWQLSRRLIRLHICLNNKFTLEASFLQVASKSSLASKKAIYV